MKIISISATTACPNKCPRCPVSRWRTDKYAEWECELEWYSELKSKLPNDWIVEITGGEPLALPALNDILDIFGDNTAILSTSLPIKRDINFRDNLIIKAAYHPDQITEKEWSENLFFYADKGFKISILDFFQRPNFNIPKYIPEKAKILKANWKDKDVNDSIPKGELADEDDLMLFASYHTIRPCNELENDKIYFVAEKYNLPNKYGIHKVLGDTLPARKPCLDKDGVCVCQPFSGNKSVIKQWENELKKEG